MSSFEKVFMMEFLKFFLLIFLQSILVDCSIKVEYGNQTFGPYDDKEGDFGNAYIGTFHGVIVVSNPRNACEKIDSPSFSTGQNVFVLVDNGGCSYYTKVAHAENAGYSAVIVRNMMSDSLTTMKGSHIDMISLFVGKTAGEVLQKYNHTTHASIVIHLEFELNLKLYLIPLVIIIGICFILMALFLVVKYWRTRIQERRSRLTPANLKKIPTRKFKEGDEYDLCAICLEDYKAGDKLRILPCDHAYHTKCVDPWLTNGKKTCPVCKQPVEKEKVNKNEHVVSVTDANERTPLLSGSTVDSDQQPSTSQQAIEEGNAEAEVV